MTEYLTLEDLLALIEDLGVGPIRDVGLLDSAIHRPQATVYGDDAYPDLDQKAAVLLESLVRNHALIDGNKRIARFTPSDQGRWFAASRPRSAVGRRPPSAGGSR